MKWEGCACRKSTRRSKAWLRKLMSRFSAVVREKNPRTQLQENSSKSQIMRPDTRNQIFILNVQVEIKRQPLPGSKLCTPHSTWIVCSEEESDRNLKWRTWLQRSLRYNIKIHQPGQSHRNKKCMEQNPVKTNPGITKYRYNNRHPEAQPWKSTQN